MFPHCTSRHEHEEKDKKMKALPKFPDYILIDYRDIEVSLRSRLSKNSCMLYENQSMPNLSSNNNLRLGKLLKEDISLKEKLGRCYTQHDSIYCLIIHFLSGTLQKNQISWMNFTFF